VSPEERHEFSSEMVTLLLFCLCLGASLPVQASSVSVTDMDVTTVNHTACIPLNQLPDHTIQHVFREYRKIRKVEVHLLGAGEVMVDVSLATGYRDGNLSAPVSQSCGSRWVELERGSVLSFDCIDQDPEGFPAVAAYAKLKSDASNSMALCQIIVTVLDSKPIAFKRKRKQIISFFSDRFDIDGSNEL